MNIRRITFSVLIILVALAFRLPDLAKRPMHTDEAVHALKFGMLLEDNYYHYDNSEYHGPTLNYFTLVPAWFGSIKKLVDVKEKTLRIVPAFFGIFLILLTFGLVKGLTWPVVHWAALLSTISPAMVFYSRYYIQEILLVCFVFGFMVSGYRYLKQPSIKWAVFSGLFLGLMFATKETFLIFIAGIGFSFIASLTISYGIKDVFLKLRKKVRLIHLLLSLFSFISISMLFFSSFLSYPPGIIEAFTFLKTYFNRASGNEFHLYPWYYYVKMLLFYKVDSGPIWSESFIMILMIIGMYSAFNKKSSLKGIDPVLHRFLIAYALVTALIFSVIPYKTPWNMLGFLHGFILLAGIGITHLFRCLDRSFKGILIGIFLFFGVASLIIQSWGVVGPYDSSPTNPYVYSHPEEKIFDLVKRVDDVIMAQPERNDLFVEVIFPGSNYWPLPWYFRNYPNVGYWPEVNFGAPAAPMIIASPEVEPALIKKLYELPPPGERYLYVPLFDEDMEIRPQVPMRGYVTSKVWNNYRRSDLF